ncbi:hypothetical protein NSK_006198 [Nannochloropsis salina CCMP1776]|uniref:Uncharacterized protein n=1 Tax=Nannochloropsis salina CCMP1776 TaxID=1027361 RepID=A0A4D9CYL6_9STRA|nr:hypothetical protein NSK_006198 [Nannochloropsis salina CCMP1776]|eukprot:TFJ82485.1 hypothetical protein NSK_006198 [Nannochloropsis salina CCMP1776]
MTLVLRTLLFPLVIITARNAAKMTIMRPEMDVITEQIRTVPPGDRQAQMRYQKELYGLFAKYQCSPLSFL